MIGRIPYDVRATKAMVEGKSIIEHGCGEVTAQVRANWDKVQRSLS